MSDSQICILCPDRERIPFCPPVCDACRSWLAAMLEDVRMYAAELAAPVDLVPDARTVEAPFGPWLNSWHDLDNDRSRRRRDYVAALFPSGSNGNRVGGSPLTGTREGQTPINEDKADVLSPSRQGSRDAFTRGILGLDPEQVGHLPLATVLDGWVRKWRTERRAGEGLPDAKVDGMCRWLADRIDWACNDFEDVGDFAQEIREYRSTMAGLLGLIEKVDYKDGIACPKCNERALFQRTGGARDGSLWIECGRCPAILSPDEYAEHTGALQAKAIKTTVVVMAKTMAAASKTK